MENLLMDVVEIHTFALHLIKGKEITSHMIKTLWKSKREMLNNLFKLLNEKLF